MFSFLAFSWLSGSVLLVLVQVFFFLLLAKDWVLMVPGVVVFCSVVVWGIEWCVLCAGGCGIVDPRSVEETLQRRSQVPQHAGQSITSMLRASSPQGLANSRTHTYSLTAPALCRTLHLVSHTYSHRHLYTYKQSGT